ncbi:MAG TPA: hydrogenase/urease maturation nickel metallochaperone HypA [Acidimicrobiia bacterium]|nr:hydrogenase/urease maturation nickel metallochaperone HypA [Acidimicrobiia bacterium]
MHEKELVASAIATLRRLCDGPIASVEIALGPGVDPHEAEMAWKALTDGTPLGEARVTWERAYDRLVCDLGGHEYTAEVMETCPYCGADGVVIEPAPPIAVVRWEGVS